MYDHYVVKCMILVCMIACIPEIPLSSSSLACFGSIVVILYSSYIIHNGINFVDLL